MKTYSKTAFVSSIALLVAGLVVTSPAQAAPATTLTASPASTSVMGGQTTPEITLTTDGTPTGANQVLVAFISGSGHALALSATCLSAPTLANCGVSSISLGGTNLSSSDVTFSLQEMGGREYLRFAFTAPTAGDVLAITFSAGAFNLGSYSGYSSNDFYGSFSFQYSNGNGIAGVYSADNTIVRTAPPTLEPSNFSLSGFTNIAITQTPALTPSGLTTPVAYSTSSTPTGLLFDTATGRFTGTPTATTTTPLTITATGANALTASTEVTVSISTFVAQPASITQNGSSMVNGTVGTSISQSTGFSTLGFTGTVAFAASHVVAGLAFDTTTGQFTGTPTESFGGPVTITATDAHSHSATSMVSFNIAAAFVRPPSFALTMTDVDGYEITAVTASVNMPSFVTASHDFTLPFTKLYLTPASVDMSPPAMSISLDVPSSDTAWTPGVCGISAITVAGVAVANGTVLCKRSTNAMLLLTFATAQTGNFTVTLAAGTVIAPSSGSYSVEMVVMNGNALVSFGHSSIYATTGYAVGARVLTPGDNSGGGSGDNSGGGSSDNAGSGSGNNAGNGSESSGSQPRTEINIGIGNGERILGAIVSFTAEGLLEGAPYDVVIRSTPQTLVSGLVPAGGSISSLVTIPTDLEAGWHSLTFTSTAADGSAYTSTIYFEVSASGNLLQSTTNALAYTGQNGLGDTAAIAGLLVALGALAAFGAVRRRRQATQ
jgi:hypothetical protein